LALPLSSALPAPYEDRDAYAVASGEAVMALVASQLRPRDICTREAFENAAIIVAATGGSTNLTIHMIAIARAAGIVITWDDFSDISAVVPLICRIYPNGPADVNHFHAAGGMAYLISELMSSNLVHADVTTVADGNGLHAYGLEPIQNDKVNADSILYREGPRESGDLDVLTSYDKPFQKDGGLRLLTGNLGRSVMKVSAVKQENWFVEAPAIVVDNQDDLVAMHQAGDLERDFIAVLRFQGPRANGMPELHKLTPILGSLQDKGYQIGLVTDGRMSGASGKIPAAIHMHPEAALGGLIGKVKTGDWVTLDPQNGRVSVRADDDIAKRSAINMPPSKSANALGMDMFATMRSLVTDAETGASFLGQI